MLLIVLLWLGSAVVVWRVLQRLALRLSLRSGLASQIASSILSGCRVAYAFAPSLISAGMVAIPAPASLAFWEFLDKHSYNSKETLAHLASLALVTLLFAIIDFIRYHTNRRA